MAVKLKPLHEQTIVITGASSGIGLSTARLAAKEGSRLVLAARSGEALRELADEINHEGATTVAVVADVGDPVAVNEIARVAQATYGSVDTWINNAGASIYGRLTEVPIEDMRRLFETNFWGVFYGSLAAVQLMKDRGGALINIGSTLSDRAMPLQGMYSASKHAVKGFTDTLRMELEKDDLPISVTLVKPGPIDTPYPNHAKNYLETEPKHVPPVYAPEIVAKTILHCAETPVRDIFVGSGGKSPSVLGYHAPRLADKLMEAVFFDQTKSDQPPRPLDQNGLEHAAGTLDERGTYPGHVRKTSLYTEAVLHPVRAGAAVAAVAAAATWWRSSRADGHHR